MIIYHLHLILYRMMNILIMTIIMFIPLMKCLNLYYSLDGIIIQYTDQYIIIFVLL